MPLGFGRQYGQSVANAQFKKKKSVVYGKNVKNCLSFNVEAEVYEALALRSTNSAMCLSRLIQTTSINQCFHDE